MRQYAVIDDDLNTVSAFASSARPARRISLGGAASKRSNGKSCDRGGGEEAG